MKKIITAVALLALSGTAYAADSIDFGNSFFNKDRSNSVSKIITVQNTSKEKRDYTITFNEHKSMQTSAVKATPLTEEIYDDEMKETFTSISQNSCIQHYGEVSFSLPAGQKCKLLITFVPKEARKYNEQMIIRSSDKDVKEFNITGTGIMMPGFTVLYYTDNSGENLDNKKAQYSFRWAKSKVGVTSDQFAYIKISKSPKDTSKEGLTYKIEGDSAFYLDKELTTCDVNNNIIKEPENNKFCGIVIGFKPSTAGDFAAKLIFNKRIISGAKEYTLYGSATDVLDFGTVYFGGNIQKVTITNTSDSKQTYSILSESKESNFKVVAVANGKNTKSCVEKNNETNFSLESNSSCYLGFTFTPDSENNFLKKIIILSNKGERREITLKGIGVEKKE